MTSAVNLNALRGRLSGALKAPGEEGWDAARQAFNLAIDQRPAAVALPGSTEDVAILLQFAGEHGLRVAPQATGHGAGGLSSLEGTLLLKTGALDGVAVDAGARTARVDGGARWQDVVPQASELGLAALHGSSPTVGVAGYTLGGGVGWLARKHGLAATHVTAVELVTGDGEAVRVDADHDPELFWALRGGGGSFGVVTALELGLFEAPSLYAGALFWPLERAADVLHRWLEWTANAPDEVTSVGRLLQFPPFPEIPAPLRGRSFAVFEAVYLGDEGEGARLVAPLRALRPELDTFATVPPAGLAGLHMDPPEPVPAASGHRLLGDLVPSAVDALVAVAGAGSGSPLVSVELRHLGGALARPAPGGGAVRALDASYLMFAVGMAADPGMTAAVEAHIGRVTDALAPYETGRLLNFVDQPVEVAGMLEGDTYRRLQAVKARVDPDEVIRANHPIHSA